MLEIFESPLNTFVMGFALGSVFLVMAYFSHWKTKGEFKRYKSHLSDKLELDAKQLQDTNKERARLSQENEHLRIQVNRLNERPDNKLQRELEVLARAEKHMLINAPGFAPAWEMAKSQALSQMETEEKGMSFPQKIFRKLIGPGTGGNGTALTENASSNGNHNKSGATETATTTTAA
ncbi:hypothetical protein EI77_01521 [Prosthecobacter fusiformis]|uniref:Uncharacterized protein n=1 Tax=Prosthecobacter fusiformis TaxID=48464 RepID=A0A4R7S419_9BACT|nr:hypothetical protein [Prosthecobacter fusiformis]TDU73054.1 hypothetical protein EI77_01521 [Prosthecobacter fusiformis]